jgi:ApaG protein
LFASSATTRQVTIDVRSSYVPERSDPAGEQWLFAYWVRISNRGAETVQLISRHWVISDAHGEVEEVRGLGVIGQQPILAPGESFEYTSFCPLTTPFGTMHGTYQMETSSGEQFDAEIAAFTLAEPSAVN